MAFITFGDFNPTPVGNCQTLTVAANVVARATAQTRLQYLTDYSQKVISQRASATHKAWEGLQRSLETRLTTASNARIFKDKKSGIYKLRKFTVEETEAFKKRKTKREFRAEIDSVVNTIQFQGVVSPSKMVDEQPTVRKEIHTTPSRKINKKPKNVYMTGKQFENFVGQLKSIMMHKQMHFEVGNHMMNKGKFVRVDKTTYCQLRTRHHDRKIVGRDIKIDQHNLRWVKYLSTPVCENWWVNPCQVAPSVIRHGMSGFVLDAATIRQGTIGDKDGCIIVRGLYHGKILDARKNIWSYRRKDIVHYTDQHQFWKGFTDSYVQNRKPTDHTCSSDFDAKHVGAAVATIWQAIAPSGKITCKQCARQLADMTRSELKEVLSESVAATSMTLGTEFGDLLYPAKFFERYVTFVSSCNNNYKDFAEVQRLIGDRTEAPFSHINRVNEVLIKGNSASEQELSEATKAILEIARYQNKRTESIQQGSLKFFRNKVSGKAKVNMKLMCDNQLDANGNLKWGLREYHAKRFFQDFLRPIDPSQGYDEFEVRRFPNGSRKLAINNLIVSTNFDSIRKQLEEESVGEMPLTNECTSKYNNQFKYPCCCVTHDDGEPLLSSTIPPIKNHLAVGNTGDSKFVDLPQSEAMRMYIARDGYCYINIFLAMYVNVNEVDAKEFTKTLRDRLIPNLGTWPTMMDVATACYYLTLFYPDTVSAELPQILVDHHTKTLHVLDSYGSKSTGYHVLKADTVGHLIWFARLKLDSAMKHYRVGGFGCKCGTELDCDDISDTISLPLFAIPSRRRMSTHVFVRDGVRNVSSIRINSLMEWDDRLDTAIEQVGFDSGKFDHCVLQVMEKQRFTQYEFALELGVPFDNEEVVLVTHGSIIFSMMCETGITDIRICAGQSITLPSFFHVTHKYSMRSLEASQVCRFRSKKELKDLNGAAAKELKQALSGPVDRHTAHSLLHQLIRSLYRPNELRVLLMQNPQIIVLAMMSPSVITALYNSGSFEWALSNVLQHETNLITLYASMHALARKVSLAKTLKIQHGILSNHAMNISSQLEFPDVMDDVSKAISTFVLVLVEKSSTDKNLEEAGFGNLCDESADLMEKTFRQDVADSWYDLSWSEKLSAMRFTVRWSGNISTWWTKAKKKGFADKCTTFAKEQLEEASKTSKSTFSNVRKLIVNGCKRQRDRLINGTWMVVMRIMPHSLRIINICILMQVFLALAHSLNRMLKEHRENKVIAMELQEQKRFNHLLRLFDMLEHKLGYKPTYEEFIEHLQKMNPELVDVVKFYAGDEVVQLQGKSKAEANLEKVVAFTALVIMLFDAERSDGVYKILNKLKGIVRTMDERVELQGLDDITDILTEKNQTVDFDLSGSEIYESPALDTTFQAWWDAQITYGRTVCHYNTTGTFKVFTRATAQSVANDIAHSHEREFLIQGAVGSGKSTGLPHYLSSKGAVLILEPTRPLAENVCKQLQSAPFHVQPSLKMRGATVFGVSPITIMTSGYALHYLANNPDRLKEFQFIIFDECHVDDSNAMAFRCLLHEYNTDAKILKVSATPPGRDTAYSTQFPVDVRNEESMTFQQFVQQQGTGSSADVVKTCNNILVYVASYNEVDTLAKLLNEKSYKVTKVDGRTMKVGNVEIETCGTSEKKHFVVATNIIENGVTLDIDCVVDFGVKVIPQLDIDNRMMRYTKKSISFGERIQRLGRVGRHRKGLALKIGHTEKGLQGVPQTIATEAAFMCFAYGLPVMTGNVNTSLLSKCTVRQARTMLKFELSIFFTSSFVRYDGSMHAGIHNSLKQYKLRESEIVLNKMAIPYGNSQTWLTARQYGLAGQRTDLPEDTKIAFYTKDVPDVLHAKLWKLVCDHKADAGFGRCISSNVSKIAYTLKTDHASLQRTIKIIDGLLNEERRKEAYFKDVTSNTLSFSSFSLASITQSIKARYATSSTLENISTLTAAKDRLLAFHHSEMSQPQELWSNEERLVNQIKEHGVLENILLQGSNEIAANLKLKGKWNKSLITRDVLLMAGVAIGGSWMIYEQFKTKWNESIELQGKGKRERQKLKFRKAHDAKHHFEISAPDSTLEEYYGAAYTAKGKKSGKVHGMGKKNKRFINMYERDEDDFSLIRFVDPVTGKTIDESTYYSMSDVQGRFGEYRSKLIANDELDSGALSKGIEAYLIKDFSSQALKADLTAHKPLRVSNVTNNIMGYPEREYELRQTGAYIVVDPSRIPKQNDIDSPEELELEGKGLVDALRDYSPVSDSICWLNNESDGEPYRLFGIGFGCYIITSSHLFMRNNGSLKIQSKHGSFVIPNTTQIEMKPIKDRDMIILRMPKDFPLFPKKLRFRSPKPQEKVCLVGVSFQDKCIRQTVAGQSDIVPKGNGFLWKHWITTQRGQCGLPLVSTKDGFILGIHTAASQEFDQNYFTSIPDDFEQQHLHTDDKTGWTKHWRFNVDKSMWGGMNLVNCKPGEIFRTKKEVTPLDAEYIDLQGEYRGWLSEQLHDNLRPEAKCASQLVTKHIVKGKCALFEVYLDVEPSAKEFFTPYLGAYSKSALNREAYSKDILKYAKVTEIGSVDADTLLDALEHLKCLMINVGFQECEYVTDEKAIFGALNMKSAVGALYSGKKKDYFDNFTQEQQEEFVRESCKRLFLGDLGVWNGSMKAELRPIEKVKLNKTRTFTAAPVDTLIAGKVCVDDFNNQFYSLNIKAPWAVGMTKFYGGWNDLLMRLPEGWVYCDADGSQFDSSLSPFLINSILNLRLHFMEEWDIGERMLENLYTEIVFTPVLTPDSTVIKKCKGNNSGQPSTVVDNTLMVILSMIYTLEKLGIAYKQQEAMIRYFVTGDDLLIAIHPSYSHLLDKFSHHFSSLGLNYDFSSRTRNKSDLWFMSHKGVLREGIYIPKLEEERIVSILEWDRSREPEHRLEAICAAMVEAWGYDELTHEIRKFYAWVLEQEPYRELARVGKAPYLAETALRNLYLGQQPTESELERYAHIFSEECKVFEEDENIELQGDPPIGTTSKSDDVQNAGESTSQSKNKEFETQNGDKSITTSSRDQDVNAGTAGQSMIPRVKQITTKLRIPKRNGKSVLDLEFLLTYKPPQDALSNTVATDVQFNQWYEGVQADYDVSDDQMAKLLDGLMVWCIENGTSPNINGVWTMMDGDEQVEYNLKPIIDHARPTLRQIMARFSDAAEAYIAMRNYSGRYMPRYGRIRNLKNMNMARYAFDFYQVTSDTPDLAREAHHQMKAAALKGANNRMFGLDGKVSTTTEHTERHTADDVTSDTHTFQGAGRNW